MRVLQVIHDYLPHHAAGSEIYTANLCRALVTAGHDVAIFTCEENRALPQWSLTERVHDGVPVFEAIYNRLYHDLSEQWDDPQMGAVFAGVLDRWRPDLLHVQGLQFVGGISALRVAAARLIPVVMTLHEYWWLCPRAGLMYDVTGRACERATPVDCARCVDVYPIDRRRWGDACHGGQPAPGAADAADAEDKPPSGRHATLGNRRWFARALEGRERELAAAAPLVQRFIAPSRFLLERFVAAGFPRERLVHADYGFPSAAVRRAASRNAPENRAGEAGAQRRFAGDPLRVGYVGTLSDYKGAEVFAHAVERVAGPRESLRATIWGHLEWFPDVAGRLAAVAARCRSLRLAGAFAPEQRDAVFAELDLLVVPSLWWENSPLTIHESWQRGVPVLASDRGGMAELLAHGGGATFAPGDDVELAALLRRALEQPEFVSGLAATIPPVRAIEEDVALLERLAREIEGSGAAR